MTGIRMGFSEGVAKTPFLVNVDEEACTLCGKCINACNVAGIAPARQAPTVRIDNKLCLGCGACLDVCPEGALLLVERDKRPKPPRNKGLMFVRILKEKKRLMPVFKAEVAKNLKRLVRK
jgi:ferredoxin